MTAPLVPPQLARANRVQAGSFLYSLGMVLPMHMSDRPSEIEITYTLGMAVANLSEAKQMFPQIERNGVVIESVGGVPMEPSIWEDLQHQLNYALLQVTYSHAFRIICSSEVVSYIVSPKSLYFLPNGITETSSSMVPSAKGVTKHL